MHVTKLYAAVAVGLFATSAAFADHHEEMAEESEMTEDAAMPADDGMKQVGKVMTKYPVCKGAVQDGCINPREAGLNWGNRPLDHWPGKPASEM